MRELKRCRVCECYIADGDPFETDDLGYRHPVCSLQVTL